VSFTVDGMRPDDVSAALADQRIATWAGHSYAMDAVDHLGLAESGGVVRAGVVAYIGGDDVDRLVNAVANVVNR
jgi:selenocysteine lyase/cysteine desulfurase